MTYPTYQPAPVPPDEAARLAALHAYRVLDTPAEAAYDDFAVLAARAAGTPVGLVSLVDGQRQWFKSRVGVDLCETPRNISFCGHAICAEGVLVVEDALADPRFAGNPLVVGGPGVRFYAGVPLRTPEGHAIGTLCVMDTRPGQLQPDALDTLERLGRQLMNLLALRRAMAQQQQAESELQRLALVTEHTHHGVLITGTDNRIVWANAAFGRLTGVTPEAGRGRRPGEVLPFLRSDLQARDHLAAAVAARRPARVRTKNQALGAATLWMDVDLHPWHDPQGVFRGYLAVVSDVSHLVAQHEQAQALFDSLPVGVLVYGPDQRATSGNRAAEAILCAPLTRLLGTRMHEAFGDAVGEHGLPLQPHERPLAMTLADGRPRHGVSIGLRLGDGQRRWLRISTAPLHDANGSVCGAITCFADETGERASRQLLTLAIDAAAITPWTWNVDTDYVELDRGAAVTSGLLLAGLGSGQRVRTPFWPSVHPQDEAGVRAALAAHIDDPSRPYRSEFRLRVASGAERWYLAAGAASDRDGQGRASQLSGVILDITERKAAEAALHRAATTDNLTGLPNRTVLNDRLAMALRSAPRRAGHGALLFIDLDHFKRINDAYGHMVGDQVLRAVAQRLAGQLRAEDTLARLGGDELVVLLPWLGADLAAAAAGAERVGRKLLQVLAEPLQVEGLAFSLAASIGGTCFPKAEAESATDLVREADTAMYAAKAAGRGTLRLYEARMRDQVASRLVLETDLRQALQHDGLSLALQGQWRPDGTLAACEALLRWTHPVKGPISPAEFIPLAEEGPLIIDIGRWVLRRACAVLAGWLAQGIELPMAVNVSPRQFCEPAFASFVLDTLREAGVPPRLLTLEITEGVLLEGDAPARLRLLAEAGLRIAIDDFGTGYSSLMYLKQLPVHELKIDRGFVRDLTEDDDDAAIVLAMLAIARKFGLDTVAEGVETRAQAEFLRAQGCTLQQGFLHDRPRPVALFTEELLARSPRPTTAGSACETPSTTWAA
ncbi:EAL domain-containing protein [Aquincola sp. J276]|uniref:bifunctional diguanylate cyclase/phosphodiesterase n=1 Tax=Aquincola sp. J276 TaxID=2898432 RepID=UPI002872C4E0|nr:EAL domain-containing protein [Aquincola sp. J276]